MQNDTHGVHDKIRSACNHPNSPRIIIIYQVEPDSELFIGQL